MKRTCFGLALGILVVVASPVNVLAQAAKTARGTVTAVGADSVTVKVADQEMKFAVDSTTNVEATGAGTKARQAQAAGQAGPKLSDVVKIGQPVQVSYQDMNGTLHAVRIRAVSSVGGGPETAKSANGVVQSVSPTSMTIEGSSGGGAKFTQTFVIDTQTKLIGKGAGTAAAAQGGKLVVTDIVSNGDRVNVSFHAVGETLHASEIRVMTKAAATVK